MARTLFALPIKLHSSSSNFLQGFVIRPGHENLVAMGAVSTIAEEAIIHVPAEKRNCYFQDEYKLDMHR